MSCCGKGKLVTFELNDHRLVTLDLDCSDDWGNITVEPSSRIGDEKILIGAEEDERVPAVRFWEEVEKDGGCGDCIDENWQTFVEVTKTDVLEWILVREICFCEGMEKEELFEILKGYGFEPENLYIPSEWLEGV